MDLNRKPTELEEKLLKRLIIKSSRVFPQDCLKGLFVRPMEDGGMGSLYLFPENKEAKDRLLGEQVSDFQFTDLDGVEVIASLNVDTNGNLFELDIWKADFSRLINLPDL